MNQAICQFQIEMGRPDLLLIKFNRKKRNRSYGFLGISSYNRQIGGIASKIPANPDELVLTK